jgi:hypothetical protein
MWIALSIAGGLVGLVLLLAVIGLFLPRDHLAARHVTLAKPPADVWRAIADLDAQPTWRRGLERIEKLDGNQFREHTSQGTITYAIEEACEPERRITRIADDKLPFGGRWIYELAPTDGGTRLTITEDGFIRNPIFRVLSKTVFSTTSTIESFLRDLAKHLGSPVEPEPAEPTHERPAR